MDKGVTDPKVALQCVFAALNRIELECEEQVQKKLITQQQANRRICSARRVVEFLLSEGKEKGNA